MPPEAPVVQSLDVDSRRELHEALLSAFPTSAGLEQLTSLRLDTSLASITKGGAQPALVLDLIQWAEAHGSVAELVVAALAENPGNPDLKTFWSRYGVDGPVPPAPVPRSVAAPRPPTARTTGTPPSGPSRLHLASKSIANRFDQWLRHLGGPTQAAFVPTARFPDSGHWGDVLAVASTSLMLSAAVMGVGAAARAHLSLETLRAVAAQVLSLFVAATFFVVLYVFGPARVCRVHVTVSQVTAVAILFAVPWLPLFAFARQVVLKPTTGLLAIVYVLWLYFAAGVILWNVGQGIRLVATESPARRVWVSLGLAATTALALATFLTLRLNF
jgi:hypothetical protein